MVSAIKLLYQLTRRLVVDYFKVQVHTGDMKDTVFLPAPFALVRFQVVFPLYIWRLRIYNHVTMDKWVGIMS